MCIREHGAAGSSVTAGGDVRISATGAGADSNLTVVGSDINAGNNAYLRADGDIALLAAQDIQDTQRNSSAASGGVGVAISIGSGGASAGITAMPTCGLTVISRCWPHRLIEFFAGPHDYIGGQSVALYDDQGNAVRNRSPALQNVHNSWSVVAIPAAAPFAMVTCPR
ncbi:hemagglutinin repeat-containing protein [Stenotrophomonas sp. C3(2023)]|uniref:hemagglutinin repeat-containing protein n=1 Tax=Stenotrophomonas sp. C3(2023) TaxID=3080277 RepID=UPI00293CC006|nr:hemagglutinin repeat-containing protein [Stenotrophomonas sp. C3(2023)]MDV3468486.1 hemagglutinin repeat-containing protein [Stenotrophomonas sp. C3(2023)]